MKRYALLDKDRVLQGYMLATDESTVAANTPAGGSSVETTATDAPGTVRYDPATLAFSLMAVAAETTAQALARMIDTIDEERETRMMLLLTNGGAKKYEYAEKAREVRDYRSLSGTVVGGLLIPLNIASTRERFGWSMAEVEDTGDSLEAVITRYETAVKSVVLTRKVAARAQKLKRQLRAATPAARTAIFDGRSWPTS